VRVPYSEGVANHTDPLSCVGHREVPGEALAPYWLRKATWTDAISRGPVQSRVVRDPDVRTLLLREPGDFTRDRLCQHTGPHREGEEP